MTYTLRSPTAVSGRRHDTRHHPGTSRCELVTLKTQFRTPVLRIVVEEPGRRSLPTRVTQHPSNDAPSGSDGSPAGSTQWEVCVHVGGKFMLHVREEYSSLIDALQDGGAERPSFVGNNLGTFKFPHTPDEQQHAEAPALPCSLNSTAGDDMRAALHLACLHATSREDTARIPRPHQSPRAGEGEREGAGEGAGAGQERLRESGRERDGRG